jgi:tryptophan-rich sensory protein
MDVVRQVAVLAATVATVAYNGISQAAKIGGNTSADISNKYSTYFTPANYAFAIWGIIYTLLFAFAIYQALPSQRTNPNTRKVAVPFLITCALNCIWITVFQYDQLAISFGLIILFLASLIIIYVRLGIGYTQASTVERLVLHLPFSVYTAWLCVATIANASALGVALNPALGVVSSDTFLGIASPTWAAIMLVVATLVGAIIGFTRRDIGFVAVFVWAFTAIISKQAGVTLVTTTAGITSAVLVIVLAAGLVTKMRRPQSSLTSAHA